METIFEDSGCDPDRRNGPLALAGASKSLPQPPRKLHLVLRRIAPLVGAAVILTAGSLSAQSPKTVKRAADQRNSKTNGVVIELFYRGDSDQSLNAVRFLEQLNERRKGINIKSYDVLKDREQLKRLWALSKRFGYEKAGVPTFYLCDSLKVGFSDERANGAQIEEMLTIKAYIRQGCKHCAAARRFLDKMALRRPALRIQYYDVVADPYARSEVQRLATQYRVRVASFPCIQVAGRLIVGYQSDDITGRKIEAIFADRSVESSKPVESGSDATSKSRSTDTTSANQEHATPKQLSTTDAGNRLSLTNFGSNFSFASAFMGFLQSTGDGGFVGDAPVSSDALGLPEEVPNETDVPTVPDEGFLLPDEAQPQDEAIDHVIVAGSESDQIEVPVFGSLSVSKLGLPTFTFLIGLVDGFNPCAMWVLVFLLSVLVNLKERKKILIVAGTFVVVSGLAYFAFMAAWFSVFQLIGLLRPVQVGLGVLAIVIGVVNIKDFFAFHKGVSFSIPESAKPGIYRRVRKIVSANSLATALLGAIVLAVVVNIVELLCTAGLPALYTEVLTMQNLPTWKNYTYLGLYISAYMLDDAILVAVVVTTLSHRRLQESEGRWLKLLSGSVILLLGVVMIFKPSLLL